MKDHQSSETEPDEVVDAVAGTADPTTPDELSDMQLDQLSGGITPAAPTPTPIPYPNVNKA